MDTRDDKHGLHICRSCNYGGTATDLVMDQLEISFHGARDWIRERAYGQAPMVREVAVDINALGWHFTLPPEVVITPMRHWPGVAREYLENRAITEEQTDRWGLGYATAGRLAGRIIIPARNTRGRYLNYTARSFAGHAKRYLEPKGSEHPYLGAVFGEQFWPHPSERKLVVVTEGALNALAVERVTKDLPVASLFGSNVQLEHLQKISSFKNALVLTDPDMAGERASEKLVMALIHHVTLERVVLPKGEDADSVPPPFLREAMLDAWDRLREKLRGRHK